jgi:hypothetical protein
VQRATNFPQIIRYSAKSKIFFTAQFASFVDYSSKYRVGIFLRALFLKIRVTSFPGWRHWLINLGPKFAGQLSAQVF